MAERVSLHDYDPADPDGDPRNDHHVWRDNERTGQNAEWARVDDQMISGN